ncbi:VWA domain containing CoxE-like family protein [Burkholderiales bacterium]|nr:VWA domain containing CoxE-like family protein [Burkholderiales bacterium]
MHRPLSAAGPSGRMAHNVVHFARVLRAAGLPVGTDRIALALHALPLVGIASRQDVHDALLACLIDRAEHRTLFDQAFAVFWRDPDLLGQMMRLLLPKVAVPADRARERSRRLDSALRPPPVASPRPSPPQAQPTEITAVGTWSDREQLRKADFETMSELEWRCARRMIDEVHPFLALQATRRDAPARRGRQPDLAAALRGAARRGGEFIEVPRRRRRLRPEPLVAIVDISGSVSRYSRVFLHFLHALTNANCRLESFVFGTRLTRITRALRGLDPDVAIEKVVAAVDDWSGGTRICVCLEEFNRKWARRVLSGSRTVLLMSDGLERGDAQELAWQTERLSKSCRRLVWLNPLLRYDGFEPKAQGIRAMLPHVDQLLPVHSVDSLAQLARVLAAAGPRARPAERQWN